MVDYCHVCFDWPAETNSQQIVTYCYLEEQSFERDNENIGSLNNVNDRIVESTLHDASRRLELFNESSAGKNSKSCTLNLKCKPVHKVAIKKVDIVSEAKNIEIYDDIDGYLKSVKGVLISDSAEDKYFYMTSFELKDPKIGLEIKFLSLGERSTFQIRHIHITLTKHETRADRSKLDMVKLKNHIDGLGSDVSEGARSLFETMEQYQKNQQGVLGEVQNLLSQTSSSTEKGKTISGLAGMLTSFSHLNQQQKNPLVHLLLREKLSKEDEECSEKSDPSKLADNVLCDVMSGVDKVDAVKGEDMYKLLHSVCGRVTKMREKASAPAEPGNTGSDDSTSSESLQVQTTPVRLDQGLMTEMVNQLKVAEERIVRRVERRMTEMEDRINRKLDTILQALALNVTDVQPSTSTDSSDV